MILKVRPRAARECRKLQDDLKEVTVALMRDEMQRTSFIRHETHNSIDEKACFASRDLLNWSKNTDLFSDFTDVEIAKLGAFLFKQRVLVPVYSSIGRFRMGYYLYKFYLDDEKDTELRYTMLRECVSAYNNWLKDDIHGKALLERLDDRIDREICAQWMLKFGFIRPKRCRNEQDQVFNAQVVYRFSSEIRGASSHPLHSITRDLTLTRQSALNNDTLGRQSTRSLYTQSVSVPERQGNRKGIVVEKVLSVTKGIRPRLSRTLSTLF